MDLAEFVLKNNTFEHNNCYCQQKKRTEIGTKMDPTFTTLIIDSLNKQLLQCSALKSLIGGDILMIYFCFGNI